MMPHALSSYVQQSTQLLQARTRRGHDGARYALRYNIVQDWDDVIKDGLRYLDGLSASLQRLSSVAKTSKACKQLLSQVGPLSFHTPFEHRID
jgi:hypothetical protein